MNCQLRLMVDFFFFGLFAGVLYDITQIIRLVFFADRRKTFQSIIKPIERLVNETKPIIRAKIGICYVTAVTVLTDTVFSLSLGICFTVFLYSENNLIFRYYLVIAAAVGFAAYYFTVGKVVYLTANLALAAVISATRAVFIPIKNAALSAGHFAVRLWRSTGGRLLLHLKIKSAENALKAEENKLKIYLKL